MEMVLMARPASAALRVIRKAALLLQKTPTLRPGFLIAQN
jgi:hypothetical protein